MDLTKLENLCKAQAAGLKEATTQKLQLEALLSSVATALGGVEHGDPKSLLKRAVLLRATEVAFEAAKAEIERLQNELKLTREHCARSHVRS